MQLPTYGCPVVDTEYPGHLSLGQTAMMAKHPCCNCPNTANVAAIATPVIPAKHRDPFAEGPSTGGGCENRIQVNVPA